MNDNVVRFSHDKKALTLGAILFLVTFFCLFLLLGSYQSSKPLILVFPAALVLLVVSFFLYFWGFRIITAQGRSVSGELSADMYRHLAEYYRDSQIFLDSVFENIPDMVFVKDAKDFRYIRFNRAGAELLGVPTSEFPGKTDYDIFPKEQADSFRAADRFVIESKSVRDIPQEEVRTVFGETRLLHTKKIPILDSNGNPLYLLGISEDITDKKRLEEKRRQLLEAKTAQKEAERIARQYNFLYEAGEVLSSSLNYRDVLPSLADVVVKHFSDWCCIDVVEEEGLTLAASKYNEEGVGDFQQRKRPDSPLGKFLDLEITRVFKTGEPILYNEIPPQLLESFSSNDSPIKTQTIMFVPLRAYKQIFGVMTFARVKPDAQYSSLDLAIAQDLAKRTAIAIKNARLYESAQEASRAKSQFLANMSHEIRTPLGAVIGFAELLLESKSIGDDDREHVQTIIRNGRQLLKLVNEILDLSRIESKKFILEKSQFPIQQLINDVTTLLKFQAENKGLDFQIQCSNNLVPAIVSDPTRLRQILINVIGNAIKFTERGRVNVQVSSSIDTDDSRMCWLRVRVEDTGIGIRPDEVGRLFQTFSQADSSTRKRFGGTGLGLYLAKRMAQALGGNLILERSVPGVGSVFVITIHAELAQGYVTVESEAGEVAPEPTTVKQLNILIVDDSPDNRELIGRFVTKMGHTAEFAENGRIGVTKALADDFDVILMDVQMPEMDGIEAVKMLREKGYHKPIVALTAHAMKGDRELCLRSGFDDYLVKPVNRQSLREALSKHEAQKPEMAPC